MNKGINKISLTYCLSFLWFLNWALELEKPSGLFFFLYLLCDHFLFKLYLNNEIGKNNSLALLLSGDQHCVLYMVDIVLLSVAVMARVVAVIVSGIL